jgi:hypothetical protein
MNKVLLYLAIVVIGMALTSCSSVSKVTPYTADNIEVVQSGVMFSLPKSLIKLDITYSLYTKIIWASNPDGSAKKVDGNGNPLPPKSKSKVAVIETPVKVSTFEIPDERMRFVFSTSSMDSSFKEKEFNLVLSKEGIIKSFSSVATDKSSEVVGSVSGIALNLAKIAAVAGVDVTEMIKDKDISVSRILDLDDLVFSSVSDKYTSVYNDHEKISGLSDRYIWPVVKIEFSADYEISKRLSLSSSSLVLTKEHLESYKKNGGSPKEKSNGSSSKDSELSISGIPYRISGIVSATVSVDEVEVLEKPLSVVHAGPVAYIPIDSGAFESNTHVLEFYDNTGQLSKFQAKGGGSAANFASALKGASDEALSTAKELNTLKIQTEIDKLKKQKELLDAKEAIEGTEISKLQGQIELLKKQQELVGAQDSASIQELAELQNEINVLTKEKELADLQKTISGTEITSLQGQINLLNKQKELYGAQKSLNELDTGSAANQLSQLEQQKQLLDKQRDLRRAELDDMNFELEKLKKEAEILEAKKKITELNTVK